VNDESWHSRSACTEWTSVGSEAPVGPHHGEVGARLVSRIPGSHSQHSWGAARRHWEVDDGTEVAGEPPLAACEGEEGAHRDQQAVAAARSQTLGGASARRGGPADVPLVGGEQLAIEVAGGDLAGAGGERQEALKVPYPLAAYCPKWDREIHLTRLLKRRTGAEVRDLAVPAVGGSITPAGNLRCWVDLCSAARC
jgi:hypothetical protein